MPTVNIFIKGLGGVVDSGREQSVNSIRDELKSFIAKELTCNDKKLGSEEISIRLINVGGDGMIGDIEIEITAAAYKERVENQDQICLNIAKYLQDKILSLGRVEVWLILTELGHSWE